MTLDLSGQSVMEQLWETLEKTDDGKRIKYTISDIEQLWWMGFVDTEQFGIDEWKTAFEPYRTKDGTFVLSRDEFLSFDGYRYTGEIHVPFDSMLINEGKYTDEGLDDLFEMSIAPSCGLSREQIVDFFNGLKKKFRQPDGLILIKQPAKQQIKALLENHPSPLRNLELLLDQMFTQKGAEFEDQIDQADVAIATAEAAKQISSFSAKPTSRVEAKAKKLDEIQKVRKTKTAETDDGKPKVELRKIRRSRKGFRG